MFYVIYPSENTSLKMPTTGGQNMYKAMLFIIHGASESPDSI